MGEKTREHDAVEVLRELFGLDLRAEVTLRDGASNHVGKQSKPLPLLRDKMVARGSRLIVELRGRGHEETAPGHAAFSRPVHPEPESGADPGLSAGSREGRTDHEIREAGGGVFQRLDLERLLGAEMGKEPALRESQLPDPRANMKRDLVD